MNCSKLLVNKEDDIIKNIMKKSPKARFNELYNHLQKITRCGDENMDGCGYKQPEKYKISPMEGIQATWKKISIEGANSSEIKKQLLQIEQVKLIFEKITDEDSNYLGFSDVWCNHQWLICSVYQFHRHLSVHLLNKIIHKEWMMIYTQITRYYQNK